MQKKYGSLATFWHKDFFSQHDVCQKYLQLLREIPSVHLILPTEKRRRELLTRQIPETYWKQHWGTDRVFSRNVDRLEEHIDGKTITDVHQFYEAVADHQRSHIATLRRQRAEKGSGPIVEEIDADLPIYLWINDTGDAVFSIPVENATIGGSVEHAFSTKDRGLVDALRATWHRYQRHAENRVS